MVSKLKTMEKSDENALIEAVCNSAHQIWQAGLGAFSRAQEEGGDVFSKLVQQGADLQKRTQQFTGDKGIGVVDTVGRLAELIGKQASGPWEKIEKVFEERVSRSLRTLGVTTQEDIKGLSRQIEELNKTVSALAGKNAAAKSSEKAAAAPKKRAAKTAAKTSAKTSARNAATKSTRKSTRAAASHA